MMNATPVPVAASRATWHMAITTFKRELIERALKQTRGNRTRAARALGLQRTYLLRLMREMHLAAPRGGDGGHRSTSTDVRGHRGPKPGLKRWR